MRLVREDREADGDSSICGHVAPLVPNTRSCGTRFEDNESEEDAFYGTGCELALAPSSGVKSSSLTCFVRTGWRHVKHL